MSGNNDLFPTLDPAWAQELTIELRIRGVDGATIGETLATAEAHCQDSGESAIDAFGPAREYAGTLPPPPRGTVRSDRRLAVPSAIGLAGMLLSFRTVDAWRAAAQIPLTLGTVLTWIAVLGATLVLVGHLGLLLRGRWRAWAIMTGLFAAIGLLSVTPTPTLLHLAPGAAAALVAVLLGTSVALTYRLSPEPDMIRHPLGNGARSRSDVVVEGLTPWVFVILTVVGNGLSQIA